MSDARAKIVQYLNEAHATEQSLTKALQSQIASAPSGGYRSALEAHLRETRIHAERVRQRLKQLGDGESPIAVGVGLIESTLAQALAIGKAPLELLRSGGDEERLLKSAKDACAAEALEIATYTALERLARSLGDEKTAELAASICAEEEQMLQRLRVQIPKLVGAVVEKEIRRRPASATATRRPAKAAGSRTRKPATAAKRKARATRPAPAGSAKVKRATARG